MMENKEDLSCPCNGSSPISLFCTLCNEMVCVDCITTIHNGHKFEKHKYYKEQLKLAFQTTDEGITVQKLQELQEEALTWKAEHESHVSRIKKHVITRRDELKEKIDGWSNNLLLQLESFSEEEQHKVAEFQSKIQRELNDGFENGQRNVNTDENTSHLNTGTLEFPVLRDVQYLHGPDILSNFPSPLGSLNFETRASDNDYSGSVSPTVLTSEKTVDSAFDFLKHEEECLNKCVEFATDLSRVTSLSMGSPDSIWTGDLQLKRLDLLHVVDNSIWKTTQINIDFLDLCLQSANEFLWVSCMKDNSISVFENNGKRKCVHLFKALIPTCIFVTEKDTILLGLSDKRNLWIDKTSVRKVVEFKIPDRITLEIERDNNNKQLFTFPLRCCSNPVTNDILVIDSTGRTSGRLVICRSDGHLKDIFTGKNSPDLYKSFDPTGVVCVSSGNIVVCDHSNQVFHILHSDGGFLRLIKADEVGIRWPYSITCDKLGNICVGNWPSGNDQKAKIYLLHEANFSVV